MLIGQPAEERNGRCSHASRQSRSFGQPDYAMAFHVTSTCRQACWVRQWILLTQVRTRSIFTLLAWAHTALHLTAEWTQLCWVLKS